MFPHAGETVPRVPLRLMRCEGCGLVQLGHDTRSDLMYRKGYGYRSSLNEVMVKHLRWIVDQTKNYVTRGGTALDIGCNDGTLLRHWASARPDLELFGVDPLGEDIEGASITRGYFKFDGRQYDVITSIAMFYDLPGPVAFAKDVAASLTRNGLWVLEVGYVGALHDGLWDGVCHEHLEYYGLNDIQNIAVAAGLSIRSFAFTKANGGSLFVTLEKMRGMPVRGLDVMEEERERDWSGFGARVGRSIATIRAAVDRNHTYVLGASTKGNTLLQACGFTSADIDVAIERNPDKVGRFTPGSEILIVHEDDARCHPPDQVLVLPYHFKEGILARESAMRERGVKFIFPLPEIEIC